MTKGGMIPIRANEWDEKSQDEQESYIAAQLKLDRVSLIERKPVVVGRVSLIPFGLLGSIYVFRDSNGTNRAVGVPFSYDLVEDAA